MSTYPARNLLPRISARKRSVDANPAPISEGLQNIGDECLRKVPGKTLHCGRVFLNKTHQVLRGLVLLAESIVSVLVEHALVAVQHFHACTDCDEIA